jgi:hypothetical protein
MVTMLPFALSIASPHEAVFVSNRAGNSNCKAAAHPFAFKVNERGPARVRAEAGTVRML